MDEFVLNKVFRISKGSRIRLWKIISNPFFEGAFALVSYHPYIYSNELIYDRQHICAGSMTLEGCYQQAYDHT